MIILISGSGTVGSSSNRGSRTNLATGLFKLHIILFALILNPIVGGNHYIEQEIEMSPFETRPFIYDHWAQGKVSIDPNYSEKPLEIYELNSSKLNYIKGYQGNHDFTYEIEHRKYFYAARYFNPNSTIHITYSSTPGTIFYIFEGEDNFEEWVEDGRYRAYPNNFRYKVLENELTITTVNNDMYYFVFSNENSQSSHVVDVSYVIDATQIDLNNAIRVTSGDAKVNVEDRQCIIVLYNPNNETLIVHVDLNLSFGYFILFVFIPLILSIASSAFFYQKISNREERNKQKNKLLERKIKDMKILKLEVRLTLQNNDIIKVKHLIDKKPQELIQFGIEKITAETLIEYAKSVKGQRRK